MSNRMIRMLTLFVLTVPALAGPAAAASFIVRCDGGCATATASIQQIPGARIERAFINVDALIVEVAASAVASMKSRPGIAEVHEDVAVLSTDPSDEQTVGPAAGAQALTPAQIAALPAGADYNAPLLGARALHAQGRFGADVVVAVIDSGVANDPAVVPALAGNVLGGESFLPASFDPVLSATSTANDPHGTFAAVLLAGHALYRFPTASPYIQSLLAHAPQSVLSCASLGCPAGESAVAVAGVAPAAKIYAMKILPSNGGAGPSSRVLMAMDRAITLRRNFDAGLPAVPVNPGCGAAENPCVYDSLPIRIANMSFGGPALYAGGSVRDLLVTEMLEAGILPVTATGNDGPAALTVQSPGSGPGALNVTAAASAAHERVRRDLELGLGAGLQLRPAGNLQIQSTSSRGPLPDGRLGIDLAADGYALLSQGADGRLSLVSGTSFAAPLAAGAAALLAERFPAEPVAQIRNALVAGADPALLTDGSGPVDHGAGFLQIPAADALLATGGVSSHLPHGPGSPRVEANLRTLGIHPALFHQNVFSQTLTGLLPGQVAHVYIPTEEDVDSLTVSLTGVTPALPAWQQNPLLGDGVVLTVVDAFTSFAQVLASERVDTAATHVVSRLQSGLVRVAVQGAPSNAGPVSAELTVERQRTPPGSPTAAGTIGQNGDIPVRFVVPPGVTTLSALLAFAHDWGGYPVNDIDVILEAPNGALYFDGATSNAPERVDVANPTPGVWTAYVQGYNVYADPDPWKLWVKADGQGLPKQ